jgi:hypothetical protein
MLAALSDAPKEVGEIVAVHPDACIGDRKAVANDIYENPMLPAPLRATIPIALHPDRIDGVLDIFAKEGERRSIDFPRKQRKNPLEIDFDGMSL